jgi:glycosyltransferase involved in cell wall biosynthesis
MVRGERVVANSDQIADLIVERYRIPFDRITIIPVSIDLDRFDPARVTVERIEAMRSAWGVSPETKVILVVGGMLRRKGHHIAVAAVRRLKDMGLKDFVCIFAGEDQGKSRYTGELWDTILASGATDVIRMAGAIEDMPAALAVATVVVNAATQPEGLQRSILEGEAMAKPVVVSDLGAGPDAVLAPPAVPEDRMTGLRFSAGDPVALATALLRLFSLPESARAAIGARGRAWVLANFNADAAAEPALRLYAWRRGNAPESPQCAGRAIRGARETRCMPATFVSQNRIRPATALTWVRFVPIFYGPLRRARRNSTGEQSHSSPDESPAARPEGRSACQRGDPSSRGPTDRSDRPQPRSD